MRTAIPYHILPSDYKASSPNAMTPVSDRLHIGNIWLGDGGLNLYDNTARLHDPILLSYTSPDPNAFDYPGINPYTHCAANPANIIDPLGTDIYRINTSGDILEFIEDKDLVQFIIVGDDGKATYMATLKNAKSDIMTHETRTTNSGVEYDLYTIKNTNVAIKLFEFFARHTNVEWGHIKPKDEAKGKNYLTTSHIEGEEHGLFDAVRLVYQKTKIAEIIHNHPNGTEFPSGLPGTAEYGSGDINMAKIVNGLIKKHYCGDNPSISVALKYSVQYKIYTKQSNRYTPYNANSTKKQFMKSSL